MTLNPSQPTRPTDGENVGSEATTGEPARPTLAGSPVRWVVSPYAACLAFWVGLIAVVVIART